MNQTDEDESRRKDIPTKKSRGGVRQDDRAGISEACC